MSVPQDNLSFNNNNLSYVNDLNSSKQSSGSEAFGASDRIMCNFKIILLGDVAVGKTSILSRFADNTFNDAYKCNVSVEFKVKSIYLDKLYGADLKIWDTCGEEKFRSLTRQYYKDSKGVLLVFDLTNKNTFTNLTHWLSDLKNNGPEDAIICLVGNKSDLENERQVTYDEAKEFADKKKLDYYEVSAKVGYNVALLFESIANKLVKKEKDENEDMNKDNNNVSSGSHLKQPRLYNSKLGKTYKAKVTLNGQEKERDKQVGCC